MGKAIFRSVKTLFFKKRFSGSKIRSGGFAQLNKECKGVPEKYSRAARPSRSPASGNGGREASLAEPWFRGFRDRLESGGRGSSAGQGFRISVVVRALENPRDAGMSSISGSPGISPLHDADEAAEILRRPCGDGSGPPKTASGIPVPSGYSGRWSLLICRRIDKNSLVEIESIGFF